MNQAVFTVKIDPKLKRQSQKVAEELGFSLSALVKGYLKDLVRRKEVLFSLEGGETPSPYLAQSLREAEKECETGWVSPAFDNAKDAIHWLKDPKKKYVRQLRKNVHKK